MIEGVISYAGLSRNHVQTAVTYPQRPGVGGDHSPVWTNCGAYDRPVQETRAVHSLEHGAVWISYQPGLPADDIAKLEPGLQPTRATCWSVPFPDRDPSSKQPPGENN
ncbi:hypothetical protein J2S98_002469 [Arthrobacter oryzae]|nr:hypothetical protein [Arthrobacter oryzae]